MTWPHDIDNIDIDNIDIDNIDLDIDNDIDIDINDIDIDINDIDIDINDIDIDIDINDIEIDIDVIDIDIDNDIDIYNNNIDNYYAFLWFFMHFYAFFVAIYALLSQNLLSLFTHFFRRFFKTEKLNPQTLSFLECMLGCMAHISCALANIDAWPMAIPYKYADNRRWVINPMLVEYWPVVTNVKERSARERLGWLR